ncbi:MAG: histidinol-phosphate transaminase [Candidatus Kryptoniota bacterium]
MDAKLNFRSSILKLSPYAVSGHHANVKLNQNENPFDLPAELKKEIISEFYSVSWNRYPEVFSRKLPEKLSAVHDISPDCIIAANGSNELIYTVGISIIESGVEVLIPQPTFYFFEKTASILNGKIIKVFAKPNLEFDEDAILSEAKKMNRGLVILGSPNNPTGRSLSSDFVRTLLKTTGAIVLLDEAYIEFSPNPSLIKLVNEYKNLIVLRTFSKAFSLAGLRVGYLAAHRDTAFEIMKVKIPFTVNPLSEFTAIKLLDHMELVDERIEFLKEQRDWMIDQLKKINEIVLVPSDANFFLFATSVEPGKMFNDLLERKNVLVRDVSSYPMLERFLRVNAGTKEESEIFVKSVTEILQDR